MEFSFFYSFLKSVTSVSYEQSLSSSEGEHLSSESISSDFFSVRAWLSDFLPPGTTKPVLV
jgi:hypothetical protein